MIAGDYLAAISRLEAIVKVDPKYPDASQMLDMARSGARNAAQLAVDAGTKSEMAADYDAALKQYDKALQLDPNSQSAPDAIKRCRARMQVDGEDAFKRGRQFDALGRSSDAIAMYEKAIKLLPTDHASAKAAKERLAALRGGN
jgi:tetratricopeptide (TPR) repeat protein